MHFPRPLFNNSVIGGQLFDYFSPNLRAVIKVKVTWVRAKGRIGQGPIRIYYRPLRTKHYGMNLTFDLRPWPTIPAYLRSQATYMPKIKVIGQTESTIKLANKHPNGQMDATKRIIW